MKRIRRKLFKFLLSRHTASASSWIQLESIRTAELLRIISLQYELHIGRSIEWVTISGRIYSDIDGEWPSVPHVTPYRPGNLWSICLPRLETGDWNSLAKWAKHLGIDLYGHHDDGGSYYAQVLIDPTHDFFMLLDLSFD